MVDFEKLLLTEEELKNVSGSDETLSSLVGAAEVDALYDTGDDPQEAWSLDEAARGPLDERRPDDRHEPDR